MIAPSPSAFLITSQSVLLPGQTKPIPASVIVKNEKIDGIVMSGEIPSHLPVIDAGNFVLMSGLVDSHAHINEPGRTNSEGFQTATKAAAAGGITTVIDMPLNSIPPTTNKKNLKEKLAAAEKSCLIDFGFWGGLIPDNRDSLKELVDAGVVGIKAFLIESGVPEFPMVNETELREGMKILNRLNVPLILHAELDDHSESSKNSINHKSYRTYLNSRPAQWEVSAIEMVIKLMKETGCRCHIVHLSASEALPAIRNAKKLGLSLTVETCPHYLVFTAEEIGDGLTQFKCAPPIREKVNREKLWQGLIDGDIDMIVSDHSPCTPQLKGLERGDFLEAWGGISSIQLSLPAVWSEMKSRGLGLNLISKWMSQGPADFIGLNGKKGQIAQGFDADLVVWDPQDKFLVNPNMIQHRHHLTPYNGQTLYGKIQKTFVRGQLVYDNNKFTRVSGGQWVRPRSESRT